MCFRTTDTRRAVIWRRRGFRQATVRAPTGRRGQHAAVRGPVLGGVGPDYSVRGYRREGLQDCPAPVHRARHDSDRRVLLRGPYNAVLLPADVLLFQTASAQARRRRYRQQNGRVLQVHAVPEPPASGRRIRRGHHGRIAGRPQRTGRRDRSDDRTETSAETDVHGGDGGTPKVVTRPTTTGERSDITVDFYESIVNRRLPPEY